MYYMFNYNFVSRPMFQRVAAIFCKYYMHDIIAQLFSYKPRVKYKLRVKIHTNLRDLICSI